MLKRVTSILIIVALFLFAGSCIKDTLDLKRFSSDFELSPGLEIPVGYGSLSIDDLLKRFDKNGYVKLDSGGLLYFTYSSDFISTDANTAFQIPNQIYNQFFIRTEVPVPVSIPFGDSAVIMKTNNYQFDFGKNEKIDSMVVKSGTLQFNFRSSFRNIGNLEIRCSNIIKGGKPYYKKMQVSNIAGNFQNTVNDDITGATIYFQHSSDSTLIPLNFKLVLDGSTSPPNPLRPTDSVSIDFAFNNLQYKIIYGNVGYKSFVNQAGSIPVDIFKPSFGGNISFVNPTFDISVVNSFGIPISILLTNVSAVSTKNNVTTNITFPPGYNPIPIKYPSVTELGQSKTTIIGFDSIQPSMTTVINTSPSAFNFTAAGYSDTLKLSQLNFIEDTSKFKATIEVTLPLWFRTGDLSLQDTVAFDFANILGSGGKLNSDAIQLAMIRLAIDNGLPIDVRIQAYFTDASHQFIDSLFLDNLPQIPSAIIDNVTLAVTGSTSKESIASLDNAKIRKLKNTKWIVIKATLATTDFNTKPALKVKFYKKYKLGFKLYVKSQVKITNNNI